jgi:membrane protein DedA with SNARE-associated domain
MQIPHAIFASLADWIVSFMSATGYFGIAALMAIESACIPLPSEIIMPFAGYLASTGDVNLWLAATAGALGCNLGSWPAYEFGRWGGRAAIARYGKWLLLLPSDVDRAQSFFNRLGGVAVFVARLLPAVRSFIALPAGMAHMPRLRFHVYTFLGSWPWCFALAYIGMLLGRRWRDDPRLSTFFHRSEVVIAVLLVIVIGWFLWRRVPRSREQ